MTDHSGNICRHLQGQIQLVADDKLRANLHQTSALELDQRKRVPTNSNRLSVTAHKERYRTPRKYLPHSQLAVASETHDWRIPSGREMTEEFGAGAHQSVGNGLPRESKSSIHESAALQRGRDPRKLISPSAQKSTSDCRGELSARTQSSST